MKKIAILYPYFGSLPEWFPLFFETLKMNPSITFIFYSDCDFAKFQAPNVKVKNLSFNEYITFVNSKIEFNFNPHNAYKICDIRPLFGKIHFEDIKKFDFYGYGDIDLIFGNIREFYTEQLLNKYDVFSTHIDRLSGHFSLFRNNKLNREIYNYIGGFKEKIENQYLVGVDEIFYYNTYIKYINTIANKNSFFTYFYKILNKIPKMYLKEQYTTPFTKFPWIDGSLNSNQPDTWFYKDGEITNNRDGNRKFMYLHFMNFKSSKYRFDRTIAPWEGKRKICYAEPKDMRTGIVIDSSGIKKV